MHLQSFEQNNGRDITASLAAPFPTSAAAARQSRCALPVGPIRLRFCPSVSNHTMRKRRIASQPFAPLEMGVKNSLGTHASCLRSKQRTLSCLCWSAPAPRSSTTTSVLPRKAEMMSGVYPSCSRDKPGLHRTSGTKKDWTREASQCLLAPGRHRHLSSIPPPLHGR